VLLVLAGAWLTLPTAWVLLAAPLLAALRIAAKWAAVRFGRGPWRLSAVPPALGLVTVAQGGAALALGLHFVLQYGGPAPDASGAVLATVVLMIALAQLAAPRLLPLALGPAAVPLTPTRALPELSPGASAD
jgi:hypothetical protein